MAGQKNIRSLINRFFQASATRNTTATRQGRSVANPKFNPQSSIAILLLVLISISFISPAVQAQVSYKSKKQHRGEAAVKISLGAVEVASNGRTNLIQWQTETELNVLGFNLYREENGSKIPVNSQLVPASTFLVGADVELPEGHRYEFRDNANGAAMYWIEALDVQGNSTWQGPFAVTSKARLSESIADDNLALLNETNATKPIEPRAKLPNASLATAKVQITPATDSGWKFDVQQEGWYVITRQELLAVGFEPNVNPRLLQLYVDDKQQPIYVRGQEDGKLDANDTVEFYGQGVDSPFSKARKYWLTKGRGAGLRMASTVAAAAAPTAGGNFAYSVERKDRTIYYSSLLNGEAENFFGAVISRNPLNQTLTIQHPDVTAAQTASLKVKLQGVTWVSHLIDVSVNDNFVGPVNFELQSSGEATFSLPPSLLREGDNKVTLTPRGGNSDISLVDTLSLTYPHSFVADNNYLRVTANGGQQLTIWGFTQDAIEVYDVTNPVAVQTLKGQMLNRNTATGVEFGVSLILPEKSQRQLLVLTRDRVRSVSNLCLDTPSSLRNPSLGADLVIITCKDFFTAIEPLKALRQSQGLTVKVVDVEDIYDEFCYGQKTPMAIKDFLNYASHSWKRPVRYALLFGDASYDPKMFLNGSGCDMVPTKLVDTMFMETASDDWLSDFNQDGIADVAIGRLPARNANEASLMVNKLLNYAQVKPSNEVLMISDINDVYDFESANNVLLPYLPQDANVNFVKRSQMSDAEARTQIQQRLNQGTRIVNYNGHGSVNLWRGNLFTASVALGLQNNQSLPIFVIMNCLNGYYQDPNLEGLAESLLKAPQGGAVAAWASSGLTFADGQAAINQEFYRLLFSGQAQGLTIGEAAMRAKASTTDPDIRRSWILFGDPSMRFQ
ncbi:MAG: hypothetical protein HY231_20160 [Acidobacteria bacterium]|nr:hypothetical protein [Acidobacteriota bacterium]